MSPELHNAKRLFLRTWPFHVGLLIIFYFMMKSCEKHDRILASQARTKAVVTQVGGSPYGVYVAFVLNGNTYQGRDVSPAIRRWLGRPDVTIRPGDSLYVDYNSADPNEFFINEDSWFELNH